MPYGYEVKKTILNIIIKKKEPFSVVWQRHKSKYLMILPFGLLFVLFTVLPVAAAMLLSLFGFSDLISIIYPIYGYLAFAAMIGLTVNYIKAIKSKQ